MSYGCLFLHSEAFNSNHPPLPSVIRGIGEEGVGAPGSIGHPDLFIAAECFYEACFYKLSLTGLFTLGNIFMMGEFRRLREHVKTSVEYNSLHLVRVTRMSQHRDQFLFKSSPWV